MVVAGRAMNRYFAWFVAQCMADGGRESHAAFSILDKCFSAFD